MKTQSVCTKSVRINEVLKTDNCTNTMLYIILLSIITSKTYFENMMHNGTQNGWCMTQNLPNASLTYNSQLAYSLKR